MSTIVRTVASTLPDDDDHPYRTGAWAPNVREWDADDLEVEGEVPADLDGVYLRNTENPVHPSIGMYHPFDGDGMLHQLRFHDGHASYRNRFIRTDGFLAEQEAAEPLWTGMLDSPEHSIREDGWGARGPDEGRVEHRRRRPQRQGPQHVLAVRRRLPDRPHDAGRRGQGDRWMAALPVADGRVGPPEARRAHGRAPRLRVRQGGALPALRRGQPRRAASCTRSTCRCPAPACPTTWPSPSTTPSSTTCPLFWDPQLLAQGIHLPRFFPDVPSRFAIVPRRGTTADIRWFEADPTYVLHWINAYEDGDEVVLDGFFQHHPSPRKQEGASKMTTAYRYLDLHQLEARPHRWRFDLITGQTKEEPLSDRIMEFGMINGQHAGPALPVLVQHDRRARAGSSSTAW